MSAHLSRDLRKKYKVRSMPIRKDDEVIMTRGSYKGNVGKVTQVYRRRWHIYVEKITKTKANGSPTPRVPPPLMRPRTTIPDPDPPLKLCDHQAEAQ